ncbi:hypothetical protein F0U60_51860 [Archangium minus]|uniref:IstB-like ATP-binding domain-containing protein n=1 Tax=Archangium minus TaxID=83450 RepID=A0ABY9X8E3_9BACT|nr:hypothetical protein F0U60_51860 [Archangium minus]
MLVDQTLEMLSAMKLHGMANYLREWMEKAPDKDASATDLVGLLADAEWMYRENKKLSTRLQHAKLRQQACLEDDEGAGDGAVHLEVGGGAALPAARAPPSSGLRTTSPVMA